MSPHNFGEHGKQQQRRQQAFFLSLEHGFYMFLLGISYEQGSKDAMKGFNYDPPSLLKICDLLCVAIGGLM